MYIIHAYTKGDTSVIKDKYSVASSKFEKNLKVFFLEMLYEHVEVDCVGK